ncbi:MAG: hypothetical protein EOP84_18115 [Verrucomicrobiaceae bacterium]|nr:MAG: hypothetical protein EOP84_18115 [Verrucomicrobiaceae bacterium]
MIFEASRIRAFVRTFLFFFIGQSIMIGIVSHFKSQSVDIETLLILASYAGLFTGLFCSLFFTPREISWDGERFIISAMFPGYGEYGCQQLEYYLPANLGFFKTLVIKFEGQLAYRIFSLGYRRSDWNLLLQTLQAKHPEKKGWA